MKILKTTVLMLMFLTFLQTMDLFSAHFVITDGRHNGSNGTVIIQKAINPKIGNDLLTNGDEIGVFDSQGNCWGFVIWKVANASITVYGFMPESFVPPIPELKGMPQGEALKFRIWDNETNTEYSVVDVTANPDLVYQDNKTMLLTKLQALLVPSATVITNPVNSSVGNDIAGNLTWNAATGATSYDYILSANSDYSSPIISGNTTNLTIPYTGLTNGTKYYFKVRGKNAVGDGPYTESQFLTKLAQVTLLLPADNAKARTINGQLTWNSVTNATSYDVYLSTDNTFTGTVAINVSGTSYDFVGLNYFTPYFWKVQAKNGTNTGDFSSNRTFLTVVGKTAITFPTNNLTGVALSGTATWATVPHATYYRMEIASDASFTNIIVNSGNIAGTSAPFSALGNYTNYFIRVFSGDADGETESDHLTFRTVISVPSLISPADNATNQPLSGTLTWGVVTGATSYDVLLSTDNTFAGATVNNVPSGTTYNYSGLANFTSYFWKVRANSADGNGNYSSFRTFKTIIGKPTITNPADNGKGIAVSGNITWNSVPGANSYRMQIATDAAFTNIVASATNILGLTTPYSGLSNFTNYFVRVYAVYVGGDVVSDIVTFRTILGVPVNSSPTNNSFSAPLTGNLQWSAVIGADSYDVQLTSDAGMVSNVNVIGTTFTYPLLLNNTFYSWHVRAKNTEGTGSWSTTTSFTTLIGPATLVSPANNATNVSPLTGSLTWNSPSGATTYRVQISTDNTFATTLVDADGLTSANYTYSNLGSKVQYFWRVYAYNVSNNGTFTASFNFTTGLGKVSLLQPINNFAGAELNNVTATWNSLNGAATYKFILSENADLSSPLISQGSINATNYVINGLNYNKTYYWAVRGQDVNGDGPLSDIRTFGTKIDKPTLTSPANNATDVSLEGQMKWNAAAGAETYQVQASLVNTFATTVINQTGVVGTVYNYTGLTNDKDHFWRVRGYKGGAPGEWSTTFTFKTMKLQAPVLVSPINNKTDVFFNVKLDWDPVTDATKYNVRIATDIDFTNIVAQGNNLTVTEMTVTDLLYAKTYYWQAQAIGALGTSNWSSPFKFNTILYPVVYGNATPCGAQQEVYSTDDAFVIDYNWSVTGGTIVGSSTGKTVSVMWGAGTTGTVTLTRSSAEWGTYTDSKTLNIDIQPQVNVGVTIGADHYYQDMICINEEVLFTPTLDKTGTFTYAWTINNVSSGTGTTLKHRFTTVGQYVIKLSVIGDNCKSGTGTITINITDECPVTITSNDFSTCRYSSPTIYPNIFGGKGVYRYIWEPTSDFVDYSVRNGTVKEAVFSKEFKFVATDTATESSSTEYIYMTILESPSISFNHIYLYVKNSDPIDLTNEDVLKVTVSGGDAPYKFKWVQLINNNKVEIDPTNIYPPMGASQYFLTVTDANGCLSIEKRLIIFRSNGKEGFEDVIPGLSGIGYMFTYPNPVSENVNIFADFNTEMPATLKIFNLMGKEVYSMAIDNTKIFESQINVSSLTAGVYTLVIQTNENTFAKQFVKQ